MSISRASGRSPRSPRASFAFLSDATCDRRGTICVFIRRCSISPTWSYAHEPTLFQSLAVVFEEDSGFDEVDSSMPVERLESLTHTRMPRHGQPLDRRVSADPGDPHFSLSFGGEAFFVVGLHPRASRPARRCERPALVFNLHDQFEQLQRAGHVRQDARHDHQPRCRARGGCTNPMLARHGTTSEARQYSGRAVGADWSLSFSRAERTARDARPPARTHRTQLIAQGRAGPRRGERAAGAGLASRSTFSSRCQKRRAPHVSTNGAASPAFFEQDTGPHRRDLPGEACRGRPSPPPRRRCRWNLQCAKASADEVACAACIGGNFAAPRVRHEQGDGVEQRPTGRRRSCAWRRPWSRRQASRRRSSAR